MVRQVGSKKRFIIEKYHIDMLQCALMLKNTFGRTLYNFMCKLFFPDFETETAYEIQYEALYNEGYRGVIFDVDNTLVPHGAPADERAVFLFQKLKNIGIDACLLSNNKEPRVKMFADAVDVKYVYKAGKPGKKGYQKAMQLMNTDVSNTFFVGDQLFTDVWGAKNLGIRNYLVKPIHPKEEIQIVLKRYLEKIVLYFYHKNQRKGTN